MSTPRSPLAPVAAGDAISAAPDAGPLRPALDRLLALQKIDGELARLARERAQLDTGAEHERAAAGARESAASAKASAAQVARDLKDAELEQSGIEDKIKRYEKQMSEGRVTSPREIANIEREIHQLTRRRADLDDKILALMERSESGRTDAGTLDQQARSAEALSAAQKSAYRSKLDALGARVAQLGVERSAAAAEAAAAPEGKALLQRYETIRARPASAGVGVARIEQGDGPRCAACHTQVSTQDVERVAAARQPVTCENCGRLLA